MTGVARSSCVGIIRYTLMFTIYRCFVTMFMTQSTCKCGIVGGNIVTFGAECPFSVVFATINRKILGIMIIGRWSPCRG